MGAGMAGFTVYEINPQPEHEGACSTLVGQELTGKKGQAWKVIQKIERKKNSSGGRFSVGYLVEDSKGDKAFMKATDTSLLAGASDPAAALQEATSEHLFERQILDFCQGSNMDKIVHAVDYGDTTIIHNSIREWVFFIIFELADGDSRSIIDKDKGYDYVWVLFALHNLSVAIKQLHTKKIAHNDIKPSNVLIFQKIKQKLGDLGRATHHEITGPFDNFPHPGDQRYAPPEQLYKIKNSLYFWGKKTPIDSRRASDLYLLGSMGYFFITGLPLTNTILGIVAREHMPVNWTGPYEEVLPYWEDAFGQAMVRFEENLPKTPFGNTHPLWVEVSTAIRQLCNPNPAKRGHPVNLKTGGDVYSVERYISLFDRLLIKYQIAAKGK